MNTPNPPQTGQLFDSREAADRAEKWLKLLDQAILDDIEVSSSARPENLAALAIGYALFSIARK